MIGYNKGMIRNIGIIAHIDAGKTTTTERMLYLSGFKHRLGKVDNGDTATDTDPQEIERGITINSACVTFPWKDAQINLIDTPGHVDFTAEVERSLRVVDGAVVIFSAREGVESQSETVWRQADKYHVPRIVFINKMDREGADLPRVINQIRSRLHPQPFFINLPIGSGPPHFPSPFSGVKDKIDLDALSRYSEELTDLLLAAQPVPQELVRSVIRRATHNNDIVPVLCGSAAQGIGVEELLNAVVDFLPEPQPTRDTFSGLVFKVQSDRHGDLHYVRIYSGKLKSNSRVLNSGKDKKENVAEIWRIQADKKQKIDHAGVGEIVGLKLQHSATGDTLCDPKDPILLETIAFPETVISMAIESSDRRLPEVLEMMQRQDPTFKTQEVEGQTLIQGMGELHLEVILHRLTHDYGLHVKTHNPRVSYRETIARQIEVTEECFVRDSFASVTIRLDPVPLDRGIRPVVAVTECFEEPTYVNAALEILGGCQSGLLGFPLINVKVVLVKIGFTEASNELAFRFAAGHALNKALQEDNVVLLEPIMLLEITSPEEALGSVLGDLQQRRGVVQFTDNRGMFTVIKAEVPLANLFGYSNDIRSLSQGRATYTMEPHTYAAADETVVDRFR